MVNGYCFTAVGVFIKHRNPIWLFNCTAINLYNKNFEQRYMLIYIILTMSLNFSDHFLLLLNKELSFILIKS